MRKNKNKRQPTKRKTASQTQKSKRPRSDSPKMTEKDSSELTPFEIFFQKIEKFSKLHMKDRDRVQEILQSMQKAGSKTLQVISDFDMTLTRFEYNGKRCPTCHNILERSDVISSDCKKKLQGLLDKYYPIEIDTTLSVEEKLPLMVEWWTKAHELLVNQKIKKDGLAKAVRDSDAKLRDGYKDFFDHLHEHSIPLLIFSAGIGDILEEVIRQTEVFHPNVKVISNYMDFDESGVLKAFKGELIHIYNKREGALLNTGHFQELRTQTNVLLLGDSLGDLNMADGVQDMENILKIGFLNDKVEERKQSYLDSYDIVLIKDESLDVPNAVIRFLTE
ncbi:cytosolic 5'-nucleotidase 3 [Pundamilia nyererei]|uniref:5'-nucleotidase n=1 Tax=Pundamilia nyererei TaxID=303518 RepID=A0A3B4FWR5_9CICH|nr:PREDICTED: 7-methylguanosine phosphate-specific 5'-nucleotidase [Pundamilia nyererei]XP_039901574.1 cytosolic 5'-nucleotidase 3-like [Simochromis diagramma]